MQVITKLMLVVVWVLVRSNMSAVKSGHPCQSFVTFPLGRDFPRLHNSAVLGLGHCSSHFLWPFEVLNVCLHRYCSSFTVHCFMFWGGTELKISTFISILSHGRSKRLFHLLMLYLKLISKMKYCCHSGCGLSYLNLSLVCLGLACIFKLSNINMWGL